VENQKPTSADQAGIFLFDEVEVGDFAGFYQLFAQVD